MPNNLIQINVNGKDHQLPALPGETLSDLLRGRLGLTGTKIGCNEAECGACTVIVENVSILACTYPAEKANLKRILTIEGLAGVHDEKGGNTGLHPLQEAFIRFGAVQCGFCIPGQLMTAYALLLKTPDPSREQIRKALKDTLCRCGGYPSIENAILAASRSMRTGEPLSSPEIRPSTRAKTTVGRLHPRPEAEKKVIGKAIYTDDMMFEGMLFGKVKRAGVPHGIIRKINTQPAIKVPGVIAVLTARDIPGDHNHGLVENDWPVLVGEDERVRYVGDAVAIVAAETQEIATRAVDLIEVDIEPRKPITNPVAAREGISESIHPSGNLLKHIKVRKGSVETGFQDSDFILERTFHTAFNDHAFLEPECSIARVTPEGRMEVYVGSQIPYSDRAQVAKTLAISEEEVHIIGMLIGGGFGGKEDITGQIHAALLARETGKPVKILFDRQESLIVHPKRHATQIRVKIGARRDGLLNAVETELYGDTGAYASLGEKVMTRATTHSSGPYVIPHVRADCYAMYTNNPPAGAFRGFGVLQSCFAIESMMDQLALATGIDPVGLRRRNALKPGDVTNTGQMIKDSAGLVECIDRVEAEMKKIGGDRPFLPEVDPVKPHLVTAWGFACAYKNTGLGGGAIDKAGAEAEILADGNVEIRTSSAEIGQGLVTVIQMIAAEELNLDPKFIQVLLSDTDLTPDGGPTTASRQTYVTGNAAKKAANTLKEAFVITLAEKYDIPVDQIRIERDHVEVDGRIVPLSEIRKVMEEEGRKPKIRVEYIAPETQPLGQPGDMHFAFSFAAQAAEVQVNKRTGEIKVLRVISANDVGTAINPLGLQGQVEGGVVMGLGNALTEEFIIEEGKVITDRLARYRIPSIDITPEITSIVVEHPTKDGPFGAKGVGEIVSIPTTPAITNAIYNAVGVRIDKLPIDQEFIAQEIRRLEKENQ